MNNEDRLYWATLGWHAHALGLPPTISDANVLDHERAMRAKAANLPEDATWFAIFCAELKSGLNPTVPTYCECDEVGWEHDPQQAILGAQAAAVIFLPRRPNS